VLEGWVPVFGAVLVAWVIWGAGHTFISGALQAWIADEVGGRDLGRGSTCAASRRTTSAPWRACSRAPFSRPSRVELRSCSAARS
jgi:hypothetical protein